MIPLFHNFDVHFDYPNDIKIFVSAAGSDFDLEREFLMTRVYKLLRKYCRKRYGVECYVCDLDWGHKCFPSMTGHMDEIRKKVLEDCVTNSAGPCFIALVGQKYHADSGTTDEPGLPAVIPKYDMGCLRAAITSSLGDRNSDKKLSKNRKLRDSDVWERCYLEDCNSLCHNYVFHKACYIELRERLENNYLLYTVGSTFKCLEINKNFEVDKELKNLSDECLAEWIKAYTSESLRICVGQDKLTKYPDFLKSRFHKELDFVLKTKRLKIMWPLNNQQHQESENYKNQLENTNKIQQNFKKDTLQKQLEKKCRQPKLPKKVATKVPPAALCSPFKKDVMVVKRSFLDLHNFLIHPNLSVFGELVHDHFDHGSSDQIHLDHEHLDLIYKTVDEPNENVCRLNYDLVFRVPYGVEYCFHGNYLNKLTRDVLTKLKCMIDSSIPHPLPRLHHINQENNNHIMIAHQHTKRFIGREKELDELKKYVCNYANQRHSFIIHGHEACGKAALASKAFKEAPNWLGCPSDVIRIIRFIGTTDKSKALIPLMTSILIQIKLSLIGPSFDHYRDVPITATELSIQLELALTQVHCHKRLLLVLVGVDFLTSEDQALTLNWLPTQHSNNVRVVITMETKSHVMRWAMRDGACADFHFLLLQPISPTVASSILLSFLSTHSRNLTSQQLDDVTNVCLTRYQDASDTDDTSPASPLHPQILACHLLYYSSFEQIDTNTLHYHFNHLHLSFTFLLQRIEDVLGLDLTARILGFLCTSMSGLSDCEMEDVLTRDPVAMAIMLDEATMRFPSVAWAYVKHILKHLLQRRHDNDVQVWWWRHPLLCRLATQVYIGNHETLVSLNCVLADHWLGQRQDKKVKPVLLNQPLRFNRKERNNEEEDGGGDEVPESMCEEEDVMENVEVLYNRRKMMQLPRQLIRAERHNDFIEEVALNFDWLLAKTEAFTLRHVIDDLRLVGHPEVRVLEEAMLDAYEYIDDDVNNMAYELTRLLLMFYNVYKGLRDLINVMDRRARAFIVGMPIWRPRVGALEGEVQLDWVVDCVVEACVDGRPVLFVKGIERHEVALVDAIKSTNMALITTCRGRLYVCPSGGKCCVIDDSFETTINLYDVTTGVYVGHVFPLVGIAPSLNTSLKEFCLSDKVMCYVVGGSSSWLSVRRLDSTTFEEVVHVALASRPTLLTLSPNQSHVWTGTSSDLIGCDLTTHQITFVPLPSKPYLCCCDVHSSSIFVACEINQVYLVDKLEARVVKKINIASFTKQQPIRHITYDIRGILLLRCDDDIIVYNCVTFTVITCIHRPCDIPDYFRFPGEYWTRRINFEDAVINEDYIVGAIMRDVRVWRLNGGELVAVLKAPIGHLKKLFVVGCDADEEVSYEDTDKFKKQKNERLQIKQYSKLKRIFSVLRNYQQIQAWRLEEFVISNHVNPPDRLTIHSIKQLEVSPDGSVVMATGGEGGELGLFDPATGHVRDLLTNEAPVMDFNLSRDGSFALLSLVSSKPGRRNKVWCVHERRMMDEFGEGTSITVPAANQDAFFCYMVIKDCRYELFKITFQKGGSEKMKGGKVGDGCDEDGGDKAGRFRNHCGECKNGNENLSEKGCGGNGVGRGEDDIGGNGDDKGECGYGVESIDNDCGDANNKDICRRKVNLLCENTNTTEDCVVRTTRATSTHTTTSLDIVVNRLAQKPFITCEDGWLVALTTDQSFRKGHLVSHMISAYRLPESSEGAETSKAKPEDIVQIYPSTLRNSATAIKQIMRLHRHPTSKDSIIVLYSNQPSVCCCGRPEKGCDVLEVKECTCQVETPSCYIPPFHNPFPVKPAYKTCYCTGFLILDLSRVEVDFIIEDLLPACTYLDRVIISRDVTKLYDTHSNVYDLCHRGMWKGVVEPVYPRGFKPPKSDSMKGDVEDRYGWPMSVMLKNSVLLYLKYDYLTLVRLQDYHIIGRVCVHTPITALAVACDERTIYVGGLDGTVSSYVVVDRGNLNATIEKIESRKVRLECPKVWDVVANSPQYLYKSGDIGNGRGILVEGGRNDADKGLDDDVVYKKEGGGAKGNDCGDVSWSAGDDESSKEAHLNESEKINIKNYTVKGNGVSNANSNDCGLKCNKGGGNEVSKGRIFLDYFKELGL